MPNIDIQRVYFTCHPLEPHSKIVSKDKPLGMTQSTEALQRTQEAEGKHSVAGR